MLLTSFKEYLLQFSQFDWMRCLRSIFFSIDHNSILAISCWLFYHICFCEFSSQVSFPANTNILYVDLQAVQEVGSRKNASCLPGMVLNLKKAVSYPNHLGFECRYFLSSNSPLTSNLFYMPNGNPWVFGSGCLGLGLSVITRWFQKPAHGYSLTCCSISNLCIKDLSYQFGLNSLCVALWLM